MDTKPKPAVSALASNELDLILAFIKEIGINVIERELPADTFLPGLSLGPDCIYLDVPKLLYPGDLLHEAGHMAVATPEDRSRAGTPEMAADWPSGGEEMGAILWSYAALKHIGLPEEVVFHPYGYKNGSAWLIDNFKNGVYIGMPFLEWIGIAYGAERALIENKPQFPTVVKWLRE